MGSKPDWDYWRQRYVTGDDAVTLKFLSEVPGSPAYQTIKNRANKEHWTDQRKRYRYQKSTDASTQPGVKEVAEYVAKVIDTAELVTQHARAARDIRELGLEAIKLINPEHLKPKEALDFVRWAIEAERLLEGLATDRRELDLTRLTEAELERLANGLD